MVNLKKRKKGFTLIELIIVIAIIAILAAVTVPRLSGFRDDAKKKADIANAKIISNTISTLIANGDITTNTTKKATFDGDNVTKKIGDDLSSTIVNHLQETPVPKSISGDSTNFIYSITDINTANEKIIIIATNGTENQNVVVYPSKYADSDYQ